MTERRGYRMARSIFRRKKQKRQRLLVVVACIAAAALAVGVIALTLGRHEDETPSSGGGETAATTGTTRRTLPKSFIDTNTFSPYVVLYDATGGQMLYSKNADAKCYPASLTKLVTALVALDHVQAEEVITVGSEVSMIAAGSSRAYLTTGTRLTMTQLLQALLLPSGNDAAYVIAVQVGRSIAGNPDLDRYAAVSKFCEAMNQKAAALGCTGTKFVNPDGYHEDGHYTTANDMLKVALAAIDNPLIREIVATPRVQTNLVSGQRVDWKNSNYLLQPDTAYTYEGAFGLKTGSTDEAGYCLAACAERNGRTTVTIVMGAKEEHGRWDDTRGLLDMSFQ